MDHSRAMRAYKKSCYSLTYNVHHMAELSPNKLSPVVVDQLI